MSLFDLAAQREEMERPMPDSDPFGDCFRNPSMNDGLVFVVVALTSDLMCEADVYSRGTLLRRWGSLQRSVLEKYERCAAPAQLGLGI